MQTMNTAPCRMTNDRHALSHTNPRAGAAAIANSPHSSVTPDRGILEKEFRPDPRAVSGGL